MRHLALVIATVVCTSTHAFADIVNGSFEEGDDDFIFLDFEGVPGWSDGVPGGWGGDVTTVNWHTDGSRGAHLFSQTDGSFTAGSHAYLRQSVDLTGVREILFDANVGSNGQSYGDLVEARALVGGAQVWSSSTLGIQESIGIDVSSYSGAHEFELRFEALQDFESNGVSRWFEFDNVRTTAVPEPSGLVLLATLGAFSIGFRRRNIRSAGANQTRTGRETY